MSNRMVLLSHASADRRFSNAFRSALLAGGLDESYLFYTGHSSSGITPGFDFTSGLRQRLRDAAIMVQLLTPTYLTRPRCLMEFGAAWASSDILSIPIIVPPLTTDEVNESLGTTQCWLYQRSELKMIFASIGEEIVGRTQIDSLPKWDSALRSAKASYARVTPVQGSPNGTKHESASEVQAQEQVHEKIRRRCRDYEEERAQNRKPPNE